MLSTDWYKSLLDDVSSTLSEAVFASRMTLIEGYHAVGARLRQEEDRMPMTELVHQCAVDMGVKPRKLWYAIQFFDTFPDMNKLPEGKNISWTKIKTKYLPSKTKEKPELEASKRAKCPTCGQWMEVKSHA